MTGVVGPKSPFQEKYLNANSDIIIAGGAMGCVPAETEFLTVNGWKKISDYVETDLVGVVSLDSKDYYNTRLSFEKPSGYIKETCHEMNRIESTRFRKTLSAEHRVPYWDSDKRSYKVSTWENILRRHEASKTKGFYGRFRTSVDNVDRSGVDLNEWEIRLQVAVAADGHFLKEGANNYCRISISKERKINRLKWICENGGFELRHSSEYLYDRYTNGSINNFVVHPKYKVKRLGDIFWNASHEQLKIILDECTKWDGHEKGVAKFYYSKYKEDADFIQYVGTVCGKTSTIIKDNRVGKEYYQVSFSNNTSRSFANKDGKPAIQKVKTSDGYKYCFKVSTGFFLVREAGRVYVTGNSSKSYIGLMRHLRWVHDPDYRGFCIRKNSTTIMQAGGLFEDAVNLYSQVEPNIKVKLKDKKIVFPSGASVSFSHYENDKDSEKWRGIQSSNFMFDESTDAQEHWIWFLISRLRTRAKMKPSIWLTCNPMRDHWLRKWVDWWLYPKGHPKFGLPDPDKQGVERYIMRQNGAVIWADSREELFEKYGNPDLPRDHKDQIKPMSITCLFGTVKLYSGI